MSIETAAGDREWLKGRRGLMAGLVVAGGARHVGVANFPLGLLRRAVALEIVPIACIQVEHHVFLGQDRLLELE